MKVLGFDIGISSIGWALVEDGGTRDSRKIIDCGARIFEPAGESHKERGEKRRARRNIARTKSRLNNIKRYLFENFCNTQDFSDFNEWQKSLFSQKNLPNPYLLRIKALENQISIDELCQIIIHIIKHRAYNDSGKEYEAENILEAQDETTQEEKTNSKNDEKDEKENKKKLKAAMKENEENAKNSPSVISYLYYDKQLKKAMEYASQKYNELKAQTQKHISSTQGKEKWITRVAKNSVKMRNKEQDKVNKNNEKVVDKKSGKVKKEPTYFNSIPRSAIKAELKKILDTQILKSHNNLDFTQKLENLQIVLFAENDNGLGFLQNRPLKSSQNLLGKCSIDAREYRASAFAPSVIEFNLLSKLANLLTYLKGQYKELDFDYTKTSGEAIKALQKLQEKQKLNFSDIRECIYLKNGKNLTNDYEIELLGFNKKKADKAKPTKKAKDSDKINTQEKNTTFYNPSKKLTLLKHTFGKEMVWQNQREIDILAGILSVNKRKKDIQKELDKHSDIDENLKQKALDSLGAGFSGTSAYCLNVIWECLENMRLGMSEYEATQIYKAILSTDKEYQKFMEQFSKSTKLPAFDETPNASLNRICAQMRQIANAIFAEHGEVAKIRIELLREVGQSEKQKAEMIKNQRENEKFNESAKKICEVIFEDEIQKGTKIISKYDIDKVKLWILQNEYDIYPSIQKGS